MNLPRKGAIGLYPQRRVSAATGDAARGGAGPSAAPGNAAVRPAPRLYGRPGAPDG